MKAKRVTIAWEWHPSYESAMKRERVVYLHEHAGRPYYWGMVHKSSFGTRYVRSYRHWVDGCLTLGAGLFTGELADMERTKENLETVENYLMAEYGSQANVDFECPKQRIVINHDWPKEHQLRLERALRTDGPPTCQLCARPSMLCPRRRSSK